jgi:hypothetical protein
MGSEPNHEAVLTSTGLCYEYCFSKVTDLRGVSLHTLTARIHSAFSSVLNALHSLRTAGSAQGRG